MGLAHCFTIYGGSRSLIVGANTAEEKEAWMGDLRAAAAEAKDSLGDLAPVGALKGGSSLEEEGGLGSRLETKSPEKAGALPHHRANCTLQVHSRSLIRLFAHE